MKVRTKEGQGSHPSVPAGAPDQRPHALAAAVTFLGLALAVQMAMRSDGVYHDDDACHFNAAVDAWTNPVAMWFWWGRPGYNLPAAVVAHFWGLIGCRVFSALETALAAYLSFLIARRVLEGTGVGPYFAALAPALVWAQPLTTTLAMTTLTETPALLYLTLATWLYVTHRRVWGSLALSLCFVTRYETASLAPVFLLAALVEAGRAAKWKVGPILKTWRLWACAAAMPVFPLLYLLAATLAKVPPSDSPLFLLFGKMTDEYGRGPLGYFVFNWVLQAGPGVLALAGVGAAVFPRRAWLPAAVCVWLVAVHSILYYLGRAATGGYPRFLVPLSGLTAVLAAVGIAGLVRRTRTFAPALAMGMIALSLFELQLHDGGQAAEYVNYFVWRAGLPYPNLGAGALYALVWLAAGGLGAAVVPLAASRRPWAPRAATFLAVAAPVVLAAVYAGGMIRPLRLTDSTLHARLAESVRAVERSSYGGSPIVTCHVLMRILTAPDDCVIEPAASALARWVASRPGTLFYRDSKYCPPTPTAETDDAPGAVLAGHGRSLLKIQSPNGADRVEVFVRTPDAGTARAVATAPADDGNGGAGPSPRRDAVAEPAPGE